MRLAAFVLILLLLRFELFARDQAQKGVFISDFFKAAGEKSLIEEASENKAELAYRLHFQPRGFIASERYRQPPNYFINVFFQKDLNKHPTPLTGRLELKVLNGENYEDVTKSSRDLSDDEVSELLSLFDQQEVFKLPPEPDYLDELGRQFVVLDAADITLERVRGKEYRWIERWVPVAGPVAVALKYLNGLAVKEGTVGKFLEISYPDFDFYSSKILGAAN